MTSKPLILKKYTNDDQCSIKIDGRYVQHLKPFQIQGIRFLFSNYINGRGVILNDERGFGKTIQTILFLSAIHLVSKPLYGALIVCTEENLNHWRYHFHKWTNGRLNINNEGYDSTNYIITTLEECSEFLIHEWDVIVIDDLEIGATVKHLHSIKSRQRIWLTNHKLQFDVCKMYALMNWISDETIGKRNMFLRSFGSHADDDIPTQWKKTQLLNNLSNRWLLRRDKHDVETDLPLIDKKIYLQEFKDWQHGLTSPEKLPEDTRNTNIILIDDNSPNNFSNANEDTSQCSVEIIEKYTDHSSPSMLDCSGYFEKSFKHTEEFMKRKGTKDVTGLNIKRNKPEFVQPVLNQCMNVSDVAMSNLLDPILDESRSVGGTEQNIVNDKSEGFVMDICSQTDVVEPYLNHHSLDSVLYGCETQNVKKIINNKEVNGIENSSDLVKRYASDGVCISNDFQPCRLDETAVRDRADYTGLVEKMETDPANQSHFLDVLFLNQKPDKHDSSLVIVKRAAVSLKNSAYLDATQLTNIVDKNKSFADCRTQTGDTQIKTHFKMLDDILFSSRQ